LLQFQGIVGCTKDVGAILFPLIGEGTQTIDISEFYRINREDLPLSSSSRYAYATCWCVVRITDRSRCSGADGFCETSCIGVGDDNGNNLVNLGLRECECLRGGVRDIVAIRLPLIGEGAKTIGV
jgi:hypothetical protein